MLPRGGEGALEQVGAGQRARRVVHRDHPDRAGVDLVGEHPERLPLRVVAGRAAGHQQHLAVAEVRRQRLAHRLALLGPVHDHHTAYVGQAQRGPDRVGDHGHAAQRQEHLVHPGPEPRAGSGGHHDHGDVGLAHGRT